MAAANTGVRPLKVAIQMDPIAHIDIDADTTFRLAESAQDRGHALFYYHPDDLTWRGGEVVAAGWDLTVKRAKGDHFALGERRVVNLADWDVVLLRQDPPFDMAYITNTHILDHIHPKTLVVKRSDLGAQRARETVGSGVSRPDAAHRDRPRYRPDQSLPRRAWRHDPETALRQWRRGRVPADGG